MRTAAAVWAVGVIAYILTVMQRTSLGVAGIEATDRFGISAGALAAFVFVQVAVYMAAQIPAGLAVDRWGARLALVTSGSLLAAGQALLALTDGLHLAVVARVLVGAGDALVFVAVLSLLPRWFPARRVPLLTQVTTIVGQLGQVLSAVPFAALLAWQGWTLAFGAAAAGSGLAAVLVAAVVRDGPHGRCTPVPSPGLRAIGRQLRDVWARPGTKLGFFGHMGTQFSMMVFALLWGMPYLVSGQGLSPAAASGLLTLFVAGGIFIGPVVGLLTARQPLRRSWIVLAVIGANAIVWTAVLALPGRAPLWLLVVLVAVLSAGGPGSIVGIDIARTANPRTSVGVAQSMVNLGGFTATLVVLAAMGGLLTAAGGLTPEAFRLAWLVQYPVWLTAVVGVVVTRKQARRLDAAAGIVPRPLRSVLSAALAR